MRFYCDFVEKNSKMRFYGDFENLQNVSNLNFGVNRALQQKNKQPTTKNKSMSASETGDFLDELLSMDKKSFDEGIKMGKEERRKRNLLHFKDMGATLASDLLNIKRICQDIKEKCGSSEKEQRILHKIDKIFSLLEEFFQFSAEARLEKLSSLENDEVNSKYIRLIQISSKIRTEFKKITASTKLAKSITTQKTQEEEEIDSVFDF